MDWTKAKTILIAALIITNIILGASLFIVKNNMQYVNLDEENDTRSFLASRNIYVYSSIPERTKSMPVLNVRYDNYPPEKIRLLIDNAAVSFAGNMSQEDIVKRLQDFLIESGLFNEHARLETYIAQENGYIVTFKNYYNDIPLESSFITCVIENGRITDIEPLLLTPTKSGTNKKEIIAATTALFKFAGLIDSSDTPINITDIQLVYWVPDMFLFDMEDTTSDTAFPTWCISYNGEKKCINAYKE